MTAPLADQRAERLRRALTALRGRGEIPTQDGAGAGMAPGNAHAAVTRQMVEDLADDVARLESGQTWLLRLVAGAVVADVVLRLAGVA